MKDVSISIKDRCLIIESASLLYTLSSGIFGGMTSTHTILNLQVPHEYDGEPEVDLKHFADHHEITDFVGMMTAVDITTYSMREQSGISCIATAGYSNTVNVILLTDAPLSLQGMVNALAVAVEAKTVAFHDLDIRKDTIEFLSGTVTDSIIIGKTTPEERIHYSGRATSIGNTLFSIVKEAVSEALENQEQLNPHRAIRERFKERGISLDDLVEAEMEIIIEDPVLSLQEFRKKFEEELYAILDDINVTALILAGLRLEEDGYKGLIPCLPQKDFLTDPPHLIADEILGRALASYIGGTLATFEFSRIERLKPGIIGSMGPFLDDIFGGLMAGVSSKIFYEVNR